jgi:hypothetical protein
MNAETELWLFAVSVGASALGDTSSRKNAVYGLNGHRAHFVIHLTVVTCEHAI